jgi:O-antigen ligase
MRRIAMSLRSIAAAVLAAAAVAVLAAPAGAQQLVDAGGGPKNGSGGVAFIAFALMCAGIAFALFFMDRVRRRASDDERR